MTSTFDYYKLRYIHEGIKGGFDYNTAKYIKLETIANNPDIDTIYDEEHPKIEAALSALNTALLAARPNALVSPQGVRKGKKIDFKKGETLHEWEVPFDLPADWPDRLKAPFDAFHSARRIMQRRMDQSIADNAEPETLYDQPRIDPSKLRVTGKFTVEAVPAPVVMGLDDDLPGAEPDASIARSGGTSKQAMWRDELIRTGIRGRGGAMLKLADLEVIPGTKVLHASGSLADSGERVVVSFGPDHAALEQRQVELAVQEADKLVPKVKMVVFCAFTFDPEAAKDIDEIDWPGVALLKVQMNTDLLTEDLKKKQTRNQSFWLMGQPDVDVRKRADGRWEVEVNGFDYFNPKTGELDSGGKTKIAMWSLDTDYNQRSLFPRQVFFPMAGDKDGWMRLKASLRAQLDEDALAQFRGTVSLPFEAGEHRRIAVKIVDDRGIESLKIIGLDA
jgi:adenine-specific DNA-methyltransferase